MEKVSKNIWALGWVSFFTDLATAMVKPLIPIYVVLVLNQGMDKLGYILAITTFVSYLLRWFGGWLSDKFQVTKPLLLVGYGLSAIMKPLFSFATGWTSVAAISATERLGKAIRSAPKDVLISASAHRNRQGQAFGVHKTLDIAGETLGGIVAFALLTWLGHSAEWIRTIFELTAIPGLIGVLVLIFFVRDTVKHRSAASENSDSKAPPFPLTSHSRMDTTLWGWFGVYFLAVFFMLNDAYMIMRGSDIGIETFWLPLLMVISGLTQTLISYRIGKRLDREGARRLMGVALWAGALSTLLLLSENTLAILVAFVFQGIFMVAGLNALRTRIGQTEQGKGRAYGFFYLGTAVATALGSLLVGQLWQHLSVMTALGFSATGLLLLAGVITAKPKLLREHQTVR